MKKGTEKEKNMIIMDKLVYEGEYVNGDRIGKGVVYYYNKKGALDSSFEVEYLNGKRLGGKVKGKEYFFGRLIFEGEYLNRKKHGKIIHYKKRGKKIYFEEYLNGKKVK